MRSLAVLATLCLVTACAVPSSQMPSGDSAAPALRSAAQSGKLISLNARTGSLEYWPISPHGGHSPVKLSPKLASNPAFVGAADGMTILLASQGPPALILYDLKRMRQRTLPDPYGTPIDIAIDAYHNIYLLNVGPGGSITRYDAGSLQPVKVTCSKIGLGEAIAADNRGDLLINGYPPRGAAGVIEIPSGPSGLQPQSCFRVRHLVLESGYVGGIAVDPKSDDLLVLDDPDECAGGYEARLSVYPVPYGSITGSVHELNANCSGGLRLNASSTLLFYGDESVSGSYGYIRQATYPAGEDTGVYSGGDPAGFTTIPNRLPN
jgi:hypothetical protein